MDVHPTKNGISRYWSIPIWKSQVSSLFLLSDRSDDIGWIFPGPSPPEWCWVEGTSHRCRPRAAVRKAHWFMDVYGSNVLAIRYPGLNEHRCRWNPWFPSERKSIYAWCCFVFFFRIYATWQERNYCFCWWVKQSKHSFCWDAVLISINDSLSLSFSCGCLPTQTMVFCQELTDHWCPRLKVQAVQKKVNKKWFSLRVQILGDVNPHHGLDIAWKAGLQLGLLLMTSPLEL